MMLQEDFIASTASFNRDNLGANDGWQRYSIRQLISNDRRLGLFVIFLNGRLKMASFAYAQPFETSAVTINARLFLDTMTTGFEGAGL
jgi:hypothetical protein